MGYIALAVTILLAWGTFVSFARRGAVLVGLATSAVITAVGSLFFRGVSIFGPLPVWSVVLVVLAAIGALVLVVLGWRPLAYILVVVTLFGLGTGIAIAAAPCETNHHSTWGVCVHDKVAKKLGDNIQAGLEQAKTAKPGDTQQSVLTDISTSLHGAQANGMHSGPETSGGVDCVDGCVFFNGLKNGSADEALTDFKQKLTLSPTAADYGAHYVKALYNQPYDVTSTGDMRHLDNLKILFTFFDGATPALKVMPKGTQVTNSVQKNGTIIQFPYTLPKDRQYLSVIKDGHELIVFTTCGNGVSLQPIPGIPTKPPSTPPPVLREFPKTPKSPHPGPPPTPNTPTTVKCPDANSICGTPLSGPEQQPVNSNPCCNTGTTPGYTPGNAEQNHRRQQDASQNADPYQPTPAGRDSGGGGGASPPGQTSGPSGTDNGGSAGTSDPSQTNGSGQTSSGNPGPPP